MNTSFRRWPLYLSAPERAEGVPAVWHCQLRRRLRPVRRLLPEHHRRARLDQGTGGEVGRSTTTTTPYNTSASTRQEKTAVILTLFSGSAIANDREGRYISARVNCQQQQTTNFFSTIFASHFLCRHCRNHHHHQKVGAIFVYFINVRKIARKAVEVHHL